MAAKGHVASPQHLELKLVGDLKHLVILLANYLPWSIIWRVDSAETLQLISNHECA